MQKTVGFKLHTHTEPGLHIGEFRHGWYQLWQRYTAVDYNTHVQSGLDVGDFIAVMTRPQLEGNRDVKLSSISWTRLIQHHNLQYACGADWTANRNAGEVGVA